MLNTKKIFLVLTLTLGLIFGLSITAFAAEKGTITASSLNVRASGSTSAKILGSLKKGTSVDILQKSGSWYYIQSGKLKGWASKSYISSKSTPSRGSEADASDVISIARKQLGKPYVWGASGPNSFDCSGLTQYVYKQVGISISRTSSAQSVQGSTVSRANLQPGDLVFFNSGGSSSVSHVGIYVGNNQMIHSPRAGEVVKVATLHKNFVRAKRLL